jgi:hypothetical protein
MMGINFYLFDLITIKAIKFQSLAEHGSCNLGFPDSPKGNRPQGVLADFVDNPVFSSTVLFVHDVYRDL